MNIKTGLTAPECDRFRRECNFTDEELAVFNLRVRGPYLKAHGFSCRLMPDDCPDGYTVEDFARDNPQGTFILSMPARHVVAVVDGVIYDTWDSRKEIPAYFWTKER